MIVLDAAALLIAATTGECADALEAALRSGLPGEPDPARSSLALPGGELLLMPSRVTGTPTVKLVTVANDPATPGGRVKGVHVVLDAATLAPVAVLDAAALTLRRTAAVSLVGVRRLSRPGASRLALLGTGPQSWAHLEALAAELPLSTVEVVGRRAEAAEAFVGRARAAYPSLEVTAGRDADAAVATADVVVCATTAQEPLFDGARLRDGACVVAVGSHSPTGRELPSSLVTRAFVVVEERAAALREAGDVCMPIAEGLVDASVIAADLGQLVRGEAVPVDDRPRVLKTVGLAWEDAVVSRMLVSRAARADEGGTR